MTKTTFTIANIAGGNERTFRLVDGLLSKSALEYARRIGGHFGPAFGGPAAQEAFRLWEIAEEARLESED